MRIALLCNDRIALPGTDFLLASGKLVAIGMPDRKSEVQQVVEQRALAAGIPFRQFERRGFGEDIKEWLHQHSPDVVLVKTFPFRVPENALGLPGFGFINFHYAPLPAWRGSNPVFWMVRNRAPVFGVAVHQMTGQIDAGEILLEHSFPAMNNVNLGIIHSQLAFAGLELTKQLLNNFQSIYNNKRPQDDTKAKWWGHPQPADLLIDWQQMEATEISALIRACNPTYKGAATRWKGWPFGISYASVYDSETPGLPGTILSLDAANGFTIACKNGKMLIAEVIYTEEGYFPGYCMSAFGLKKNERLC